MMKPLSKLVAQDSKRTICIFLFCSCNNIQLFVAGATRSTLAQRGLGLTACFKNFPSQYS